METKQFRRIAVVYLTGLLLGGIYVGMVAPVRTVIQADLGIDSSLGIWIINIYTLFYASTIPISGSLADRYGRRPVFLWCLLLFTLGSLLCGLTQTVHSAIGGTPAFGVLMVGRVIQAAGAGGIIPAATAELGTSAPEGQRGMWLGIAAGISGIANVVGAAVGSAVISLVGASSWSWAFFIAVPLGVALLVGGFAWLPHRESRATGKLDIAGSLVFTAFVVLLLLALKDISFSQLLESLTSINFLGMLLGAILLGVAFFALEKRAENPVLHPEFFTDKRMVIILVVSFFVGCSIISMQLIPEFAEAVLNAPVGSGGYYMTVIGIFAIAGPPTSGKLIDRFGAKPVLIAGLAVAACGFIFLATAAIAVPGIPTMLIGLGIMGLGMGFSMGTPLNYLALSLVPAEKSTSAIATLTLVRQMGTTLAPAFLVSFTLNGTGLAGYAAMLLAVAVFNGISILFTALYPEARKAR